MKKTVILYILISCKLFSFSQLLSESDIKQLAQKINIECGGLDIDNGITARGCFAIGRTLFYEYDVDENWYSPENMKDILIANLKEAGYAEFYYNNDVSVNFHYYTGNKLRMKISIYSKELSNLHFILGDFISINSHPKAKGVKLKIKCPIGWEIEEGDRPNIVKKMTYKNNMFGIQILDNVTFISRNQAREILSDTNQVKSFIEKYSSAFQNSEVLDYNVVSVDRYPAIEYTLLGYSERMGLSIKLIIKTWLIFYEDKFVMLHTSSNDMSEYRKLEPLYKKITNSVIFPDQYE